MGTCGLCKKKDPSISNTLSLCADCIRNNYNEVKGELSAIHAKTRIPFELHARPPKAAGGDACGSCVNGCVIKKGDRGYCGVKINLNGEISGGGPDSGHLSWYKDPLPTNCVADWICPAGTGAGYPKYTKKPGPEYGYENLAVFYHACTFNCLFCQNHTFKTRLGVEDNFTSEELADAVDDHTSCVCYFGGDPTPFISHSIFAAREMIERKDGDILRICWETNGAMNESHLREMAEIVKATGGIIKFDLKAKNDNLHKALTGSSNRQTLKNFRILYDLIGDDDPFPHLVASTLMVPGYIDKEEIKGIAEFITSVSPDIPYSLLAFHPHFYMEDLPMTSRYQALYCYDTAKKAGLTRVKVGNIHLLT